MLNQNTAALSLPRTKTVRGYEIKRLPLGGYLQAVHALQELPGDLLTACFPGQSLGEVLGQFKRLDEAMLQGMIGNILLVAPKHLLAVVALLTGIGEKALLDDPDIGLDGLIEILSAWVEVNELGDFPKAVRELLGKARTASESSLLPNTGFKGLLRKVFPSA